MGTSWNADGSIQYSDVALSKVTYIDALLAGGTPLKWGGALGVGATITYSFPGNLIGQSSAWVSGYSGDNEPSNMTPFDSTQAAAAKAALQTWANVANLTFTQVLENPSNSSTVGVIRFAFYNGMTGAGGWAYGPGRDAACGDVWLNPVEGWTSAEVQPSTYGFATLIHEIGHSLGLSHPLDNGTAPGYDERTTIMSYNSPPNSLFRTVTYTSDGNWHSSYDYIEPETPMPDDIAAIQYMYGANTSYHSGDDTYTFDPSKPFFKTIWDAGGNDTISVSNFTRGCTIDLRPGHSSSINIPSDALPAGQTETNTGIYDGTDNLAIAYGVTIENAIGGSGNDRLQGNSAANLLDGGAGTDTAVFSGLRSAYSFTVRANGDVGTSGPDGADTVRNIEEAHFDDSSSDIALMGLLPTAHLSAQLYYAKVDAYFLAMTGYAASDTQLAQYADLLAHESGSVWLDANGIAGNTGSLVGALNASFDFTNLTGGKSNSVIVDEMFQRLTGTAISQDIHDYYVTKLDGQLMKVKGLANAMLNDLVIMPKADNTLGQPGAWLVNMFDSLTPTEYIGYIHNLKLIGVGVTNLDASGNLTA